MQFLLLSSWISSVSASALFGAFQQKLLTDKELDLSVPGQNPLVFCRTTDDYSLVIENVDLTPNPPKAGHSLLIEASGNFTKLIEKGAYVNLAVKYRLITLIKQTADLCEQTEQVDESCPLKGHVVIRKTVDIPKEVPPGDYTVLADVYTKDDEQITCLQAKVHF